jgi:beta-galactosidase
VLFAVAATCAVLSFLPFLIVAPPSRVAGQTLVSRSRVDLNSDWRFAADDAVDASGVAFDDAAWQPVTVPHTWNALDGQDGGANYRRGAGWYRRHHTPPADWAGRRFWLQFDGANTVTDVWVNGTHLGQHRGGYGTFRFDATAAIAPGKDNLIAVRVSNVQVPDVAPLDADYTFFGGLYRDVSMWVTDPLAVDLSDLGGPGVYVRTRDVTAGTARIDVTTLVRNSDRVRREVVVRSVVTDGSGRTVGRASSAARGVAAGAGVRQVQQITLAAPRLWRGRVDPYLYRVRVELRDATTGAVVDTVTERFGVRVVTVDPDRGLFLNGDRVDVHGVTRHQDKQDKGWALTDADHDADFDIMDEMGVNALRTAHYPQDARVYELADERGFLVWTQIPLAGAVGADATFAANARQQVREMIRQNLNHPSIAFWGIGSGQLVDDVPTNALLEALAGEVAREDPDRLSAYAHATADVDGGLTTHSDVIGYDRYNGWYYGSPEQLGPFLDAAHRAHSARRMAVAEYGAGGSVAQHEAVPRQPDPYGPWHPEEYQARYHEVAWRQLAARPYLWGTFLCAMFDSAADTRTGGGVAGEAAGRDDKGLVTYDRAVRKDAYYWYKANWTTTPFVYITGRRWTERGEAVTSVKVYGTAERVQLTVNGVAVGPPVPLTGHVYTWTGVALTPGVNTITVTGTANGTPVTDDVLWTLR